MTDFNAHLRHIRDVSKTTTELGAGFEWMVQGYFRMDPVHQNTLGEVWTWQEWQTRNPSNFTGDRYEHDDGIDLVAELRESAIGILPHAPHV